MKETIKTLALDHITIDPRLQMREAVDEEYVGQLAEILKDGKEFTGDLPVVFNDGNVNWLADGFHRYAAHRRAGVKKIKVLMKSGTTFRDAWRFALSANAKHGKRRTNEDKRRCVLAVLADAECAKYSDRQIADLCGVGHVLVGVIRAESTVRSEQSTQRVGKDGRVIDTANIGKKKPAGEPLTLEERLLLPDPNYVPKPGDPEEWKWPLNKQLKLTTEVLALIVAQPEPEAVQIAEQAGCTVSFAAYLIESKQIADRVDAEAAAGKASHLAHPFAQVEGDKSDEGETEEPVHDGDHTGGGLVGQQAAETESLTVGLVDAKGRPVPESIREVFEDGGEEFRAIIRTIGETKTCIAKLRKEPGGERLTQSAEIHAENLHAALFAAKPYIVCPTCGGAKEVAGKPCTRCQLNGKVSAGWLSRGQWDSLTPEMQELASSYGKGA